VNCKGKYRLFFNKLSNGIILYHKNEINKFTPYINQHKNFFTNNTLDTNYLGQIRKEILLNWVKKVD
jgi:hypothetical protein